MARRDHRRRAGAVSGPEHRAGRGARHLADGVLEPVAEERLEPRRHRSGARPRAHPQPRRDERTPDAGPGRALRRRRARYGARRQGGRAAARVRALDRVQARRAAASRARADRSLHRRLDGLGERLQPVRDANRTGWQRPRLAVAEDVGRAGQAGPRPDQGRPARQRRGQAAAHRPCHGEPAVDDPQRRAGDVRDADTATAVPGRGDDRPYVLAGGLPGPVRPP